MRTRERSMYAEKGGPVRQEGINSSPTELLDMHLTQAQSDCLCWSGTSTAPSRFDRPAQELRGSPSTYSVRDRAWDKIPRIGEAKNPGPELPRELYLDRKMFKETPSGYVLRMEAGSGMFTLSPHSEWRKDPHHMKL